MTSFSPLADRFPRFTEADWRALVAKTARRAPDEFAGHSDDAIAIGPIYGRHAGAHPIPGRTPGQSWRIVQRLGGSDPIGATRECREAIEGGADGVAAMFEGSAHPLGGALPIEAARDIALAFGRALADGCHLRLDAGEATPALAVPFIELAARKRWQLALAFDPIAALAARGDRARRSTTAPRRSSPRLDPSTSTRSTAASRLPTDGFGTPVAPREAQELAAVLATVVWLLRRLVSSGLAADRGRREDRRLRSPPTPTSS